MENFDFYRIGQKHAKDEIMVLKQMADAYGKRYGKEAKENFELGIVSLIPQYANFLKVDEDTENIDMLSGTKDYGEPNTRNNSYFDGIGTGKQYIEVEGRPVYNDPEKRTNKKHM